MQPSVPVGLLLWDAIKGWTRRASRDSGAAATHMGTDGNITAAVTHFLTRGVRPVSSLRLTIMISSLLTAEPFKRLEDSLLRFSILKKLTMEKRQVKKLHYQLLYSYYLLTRLQLPAENISLKKTFPISSIVNMGKIMVIIFVLI